MQIWKRINHGLQIIVNTYEYGCPEFDHRKICSDLLYGRNCRFRSFAFPAGTRCNNNLMFDVYFITQSFLTYSFFSPKPALSTISRPLSSYACVQSHYEQPCSAVAIATCEVQVSAADSQTVPTIATGVSKPLCCRLTSENLSLYTTLLLYRCLYNYAAHAADILTPTTVVQGAGYHSWGLYCRRCYCIWVCWWRTSRIFHFLRWLGQLHTVLTKDESPHTGYTFTPWVVSFTPLA